MTARLSHLESESSSGSPADPLHNMLTILGKSTSINVRKVLWTCTELQLTYRLEQWGSGFRSTDTPEFRALNPNAMVPVIRDGELVLWESNTICRYLATKEHRVDLLPQEAGSRALVEQWMDWQAAELNNSWRYAFMALVRQSTAHTAEAIAASARNWNRHMEILDAQLATTGAYVTGAVFTLADVVLGLSTHRWFMTPMDKPLLPAVSAYYERLSEREGFRMHGRNGIP
jgi:glutathione S-transferase